MCFKGFLENPQLKSQQTPPSLPQSPALFLSQRTPPHIHSSPFVTAPQILNPTKAAEMQTSRAFLSPRFTSAHGASCASSTVRIVTRSASNTPLTEPQSLFPLLKDPVQAVLRWPDVCTLSGTGTLSALPFASPPLASCPVRWVALLSARLGPGFISMVRTCPPPHNAATHSNPATRLPLTSTPPSIVLVMKLREKEKNGDNNRAFLHLRDKIKWSHMHVMWMHRGVERYKKRKILVEYWLKFFRFEANCKPTDPWSITNTYLNNGNVPSHSKITFLKTKQKNESYKHPEIKVAYVQRNRHNVTADLFSGDKLHSPEENWVGSLKKGKRKEYL